MLDCVYSYPCGFNGDPVKPCTCVQAVVTKYQKRISGPLLDRIDIYIEVPRVDYEKLSGDRVGESLASIHARVQVARNIQQKRFSSNGSSDIICNADMRVGEIRQFCKLQEESGCWAGRNMRVGCDVKIGHFEKRRFVLWEHHELRMVIQTPQDNPNYDNHDYLMNVQKGCVSSANPKTKKR